MENSAPQKDSRMTEANLNAQKSDTTSSLTGNIRNSNVELLRLIAMFLIIIHHFVYSTDRGAWITFESLSLNKFIFQIIFLSGGWIGNVIFFTISVWFLLDKHLTIKNSFKRIWLLEREMLFWSLSLFALTIILKAVNLYEGNVIALAPKSMLPLSFDLWWYPTSYALFLLFLPYLSRGMQSLGQSMHGVLAASLLCIWGVAAFIPKVEFNLDKPSVFIFIYLFILISYYKWYMKDFSNRTCILMVFVGLIINTICWLIAAVVSQYAAKIGTPINALYRLQSYLQTRWSLTEIMIGFGIFLLFSRRIYYSKFINVLAASAFGAYLIHCYPSINRIWLTIVPASQVYQSSWSIILGLLWPLAVFIICLLADLLRQGLFAITVNRNKGKWFELFCSFVSRRIKRINQKHKQNQGQHCKHSAN